MRRFLDGGGGTIGSFDVGVRTPMDMFTEYILITKVKSRRGNLYAPIFGEDGPARRGASQMGVRWGKGADLCFFQDGVQSNSFPCATD